MIVAIEPGPQAYGKLQSLSKKDKKVVLLNLAAGKSAGFKPLYQFSDDALNSLHKPNGRFHKRYGGITKTCAIEVNSLDRLVEELITRKLINLESRGFLMIDVQGSELEVLDGGVKSLGLFQGIQVELNALALYNKPTNQTRCLKKMEELGFAVGSFMPVSREGFALIDYDAIFIRHPNLHSRISKHFRSRLYRNVSSNSSNSIPPRAAAPHRYLPKKGSQLITPSSIGSRQKDNQENRRTKCGFSR